MTRSESETGRYLKRDFTRKTSPTICTITVRATNPKALRRTETLRWHLTIFLKYGRISLTLDASFN